MSVVGKIRKELEVLSHQLGAHFTLKDIREYIEQRRNKPLLIEKDTLPVMVTGYVIFLSDVDLICTRTGLDPILEINACSHEMAHILLHSDLIPTDCITYDQFIENKSKNNYTMLHREIFSTEEMQLKLIEREAETMARYIAALVIKAQNQSSRFTRKLFG